MIPYASQTSGPNRAAIERAGWRQFVSPDTRAKNGVPTTAYAIDNGAWGAFVRQQPWDPAPFERLLAELGAGADFVVVPDVVRDRDATLRLLEQWLDRLAQYPCYAVAQDGMTWADLERLVPQLAGVCVGGSFDWKWTTLEQWCVGARAFALPLHVLRVNAARRIRMCWNAGVASFDGSGVSRYAEVKLPLYDGELRDCMRHEVRQKWLF